MRGGNAKSGAFSGQDVGSIPQNRTLVTATYTHLSFVFLNNVTVVLNQDTASIKFQWTCGLFLYFKVPWNGKVSILPTFEEQLLCPKCKNLKSKKLRTKLSCKKSFRVKSLWNDSSLTLYKIAYIIFYCSVSKPGSSQLSKDKKRFICFTQ